MGPTRVEVAVLGAGVIGLAIAREFARAGREVLVLEQERTFGRHTSSRNSEVIHAGIYYPQDSLKARLCVSGKAKLYAFCEHYQVAHRRLGKLIVATCDEELPTLDRIRQQAARNGVDDLVLLSQVQLTELEPGVHAVAALWSPSTGIIDSHGFMSALKRDLEDHDGSVAFECRAISGQVRAGGIELTFEDHTSLLCNVVINAAGLFASDLARSIRGLDADKVPTTHYAKGHYFNLQGKSPFTHLVYPVPMTHGLGTHVTLDLAGQARFGPDVSWIDGVDYSFDEDRAASFYPSIRRYYPALQDGALVPAYTGIRPKLGPAGSPATDFVLQGPADHGIGGLINLYGIESPGLTASLAIAEQVVLLAKNPAE